MVISNAPASSVIVLCSPISAGLRAVISVPAKGACVIASITTPEMVPLGCAPALAASTRTAMPSARAARRRGSASVSRFPTVSMLQDGVRRDQETVRQEQPARRRDCTVWKAEVGCASLGSRGGPQMGQTRRNFLKLAGAAGIGAAAAPRALQAGQKARTVAARGNGNAGPKELPKNMTFCTLRRDGRYVLGVRTPRGVLDMEKAAKALRRPAPTTIDEVLQGTDVQALKALVDAAVANGAAKAAFVPEEQAPFGPCVTNPEKIMMLGYNYKKHVIETKRPMPDSPVLFNKYNNALNWHGGVINLPPKVAKKFDYEVELVVVMGKTARDVPKEKALDYVFGYTVGNDFSARDLQFKTPQLMLGKTSDGFGPVGPWLVTADQIPNVQKLGLQTRVNGEIRQNSNTDDMIFDVATIVSYTSQVWTLKPGDIFFTGTPEGVILGKPEAEQVWLKAGDVVVTSIEKLGDLRITLAPQQQA